MDGVVQPSRGSGRCTGIREPERHREEFRIDAESHVEMDPGGTNGEMDPGGTNVFF